MQPQFKVGDVVRLKSGGPKMTVEATEANGNAFCVWIDETTEGSVVKAHAFNPGVLEPA